MSLKERRTHALDRWRLWQLLLIAGLGACGDAAGPPEPLPVPVTGTVTGTVRSNVDGGPVAGATVSIRNRSTTSGTDGGFQLDEVSTGTTTLNISRSGFDAYSAQVTIQAGVNTHQVTLSFREVYAVGRHVIYVPARAPTIHGVIVAIGGPDTRCMVDSRLSCNLPGIDQELTGRVQQTGSSYRNLAAAMGLAVLGGPMVVEEVVDALSLAATATQRPELATAPFLAHGMSGGAPGAYRLVMNNPGRAVGLILKVAAPFALADPAATRSIPALMIISGADDPEINSFNRGVYTAHRDAGGLWAFAEQPGEPHHSLTTSVQALYMSWIVSVLEKRLPATPGDPLRTIDEEAGWLGSPVNFDIASWTDYTGDRGIASWLPSQGVAVGWRRVVQP